MYRAVALLIFLNGAWAQEARSPQDLLNEAVKAQQSGHLDEAIRNYQVLLKTYPDVPEIRSNLGAAFAGEGRYTEAIEEYKRALQIKPNPQVRLNLGLAYYKTEQLAQTVETLNAVHKEMPGNVQAITVLADCYLRMGKNKEVVGLMTPVQAASPDTMAYNYLLGTALVRDGQAAKGQVMIDKILKNGDSAEARLLLGTTKYMVGDFAGALADLQKAVDMNSNLPDLYAYYGLALMITGDQSGARKAFEHELKSNPNNFDANLRLGVLLREDQDYDGAMKFLQHALQVRPGDFGPRYQIASIELAKGQLAESRRDLEAIIKDAPQFTEAHVTLATVYYREKNKAAGDRERAIVLKLNAERQAKEPGAKTAQ